MSVVEMGVCAGDCDEESGRNGFDSLGRITLDIVVRRSEIFLGNDFVFGFFFYMCECPLL